MEEKPDHKMNKNREKLASYLANFMGDEDIRFLKSKDVAKYIGMTPRQVGTELNILSEMEPLRLGNGDMLKISQWSYSRSTTWALERINPTDILL